MKPIAIGLSPNTMSDDVALATKQLFAPHLYKKGNAIIHLEKWFTDFFIGFSAISFVSGRGCLLAILKSLDIGIGDEVILQAFTCVVVSGAIIATKATPIYADITPLFCINPKDFEKKITSKTKAVIVQHTFGIPANIEEIMRIAKKHNVFVIEDVAHTIGTMYQKNMLGTFGIASFFSFGRDKAFSSVFGGMVITKEKALAKKIRLVQQSLAHPSNAWIVQQLLHPILFSVVLPTYNILSLGKLLLVFAQKIKMVSFPVVAKEKQGIFDENFFKKMPNALAMLALHQLSKITTYNDRRQAIVCMYKKNLTKSILQQSAVLPDISLLRFPVLVQNPLALRKYFRKYNIYIGDWYGNVIDPKTSNLESVGYVKQQCPNAEMFARAVINLPTYPTMTDTQVQKVIDTLNIYE